MIILIIIIHYYIYAAMGLPSIMPLLSTSMSPVSQTAPVTQASPVSQTSPVSQASPVPTESGGSLSLYISVSVGGGVVVLIAATVIVISVTVCLRKMKGKHVNTLTDNVAYGVSEKEMELSTNAAYIATHDNTSLQDKAEIYEYVAIYY